MKKGKLVIINGASSCVKTSTCRAIQDLLEEQYILLGLDVFSQTTPPKQNNMQTIDRRYFTAQRYVKNGLGYFDITTGPLLDRVIYTSYKAIGVYLDEGINVVPDQLFWDPKWFHSALRTFMRFSVFFVGMHVSEEEGARREKQRGGANPNDIIEGGRMDGWNRTSEAITHRGMIYDFEIDSSNLSIQETAYQIINAYQNTPHPSAFKSLEEKWFLMAKE